MSSSAGGFCGLGKGEVHLLCPALNMLPSLSSSPDRKTSRTALLFLRSFLSTAFLALFLSRGSLSLSVCVCVSWVLPPDLTIDGINGAWNNDIICLDLLKRATCDGENCLCQQQHNVCVCSAPVTVYFS